MSRIARLAAARRPLRTGCILGACLCLAVLPARSADTFQQSIRPLLQQYCYACHNDEKQKGDLSLEKFSDLDSVRAGRQAWVQVQRMLAEREMPPDNKPQPSDTERELLLAWLKAELFPVDCDNPDPGRVTIRRLNRTEYNNTIRDLVGLDLKPAESFPPDDTGYGFDNIGDSLSMSPLLLEKYLDAAERVLGKAVVDEDSSVVVSKVLRGREGKSAGDGPREQEVLVLSSQGEISAEETLASAGGYVVRVRAYAQQAGPEPARMALRVDGRVLTEVDVQAQEAAPGTYEIRTRLESGKRQLAAAFLNDYYNPQAEDPSQRDRNLYIESLVLVGPLDAPKPPLPDSHRRIFVCEPTADPRSTNECFRTILSSFTRRAFRRPVSESETTRLVEFAAKALESGNSFEKSVKLALQSVLVSPHFLFRGELQPEPNNPLVVRPIDEFALASRLSYFLWSSMPDETLFELAERGQLRKELEGQVVRMLGDSRSVALVENFAGQWLEIRSLASVTPDATSFPQFDEDLRVAMIKETELLFEHIKKEDRSVLEFLTADYTFVNSRLAQHYGLKPPAESGFQKVSVAGGKRGGVLSHASVLTLTSNPTRTSPVKRGKWVLENLLAQPPPPPPADVPPLKEGKEAVARATLRQRMEQHRSDPLCASCHKEMDPVGFSLEHFDGIGAWRDTEGGLPIDSSGAFKTGESFSGPGELQALLAGPKREAFLRCLAEKMLTYALGRGLEYYDRCAVDRIVNELKRNEHRFSALVMGIVKSAPFQMRRGERAGT